MKVSVQISRGIESLFGTRDENIRVLESGLGVSTRLLNDCLEIEGEEASVIRAASILEDYFALVKEGQSFSNGDLNSYLHVVTEDPEVTLRSLVHSGRQRNFGKKVLAPKTVNQRRYVEAIERHDLVFGIGPAGTGKTYLAVAMAVSALLNKRVSRIVLTRLASGWDSCRAICKRRWTRICGRCTMRCMTCWSPTKWRNCWSAR
jgi:phosphate starvation-inducible PhoH-like protein